MSLVVALDIFSIGDSTVHRLEGVGFEPSVRIPDFLDFMDSLMPAGLHNLHA